jgi:hypothetical protein
MKFVRSTNANGAETVRPDDDELHRGARKALHQGGHAVFGMLPVIVDQVIRHKVWKTQTREFKNFGEYALSQTSAGLSIENNQQLWMLRCALDVTGKHVKEWAEVLEEVERAVKVWAKEEGKTVRGFNGNSLETLGKACADLHTKKITYLPSRSRNVDGDLIRLRRNDPETYRKVISGKMTLPRKESDRPFEQITQLLPKLTAKEMADLHRLTAPKASK